MIKSIHFKFFCMLLVLFTLRLFWLHFNTLLDTTIPVILIETDISDLNLNLTRITKIKVSKFY